MKIYKGEKKQYIPQRKEYLIPIAIIEIDEQEQIYVVEGNRGDNPDCDILVRYSHGNDKRTPKHAHWAVDLLLKKSKNKKLTKEFITELKKEWEKCEPLKNREFTTIKTIANKSPEILDSSKYKELSNYGEYNIDFLVVLLVLLMYQEKTNNNDAHIFIDILNKLIDDELDIYGIISAATYRGGN